MKFAVILVFMFLVSTLSGIAQAQHRIKDERNLATLNILTIGDSNGAAENGWPAQLRKLLPFSTIINKSISGNTIGFDNLGQEKLNTLKNIDIYLDEAKSELGADRNFNVILIGLGTNDTKKIFENRQKEVTENLQLLIEKIIARPEFSGENQPVIIVISPPPMEEEKADQVKYGGGNQRIELNNIQFKKVAEENKATFIDINTELKKAGAGFTVDGVHLTNQAQLEVAGMIAEKIGILWLISEKEQQYIIKTATQYIDSLPVTVTATFCERSAGGIHDFYSEGDYWWPDPQNPDGPYIQKDGQTNPANFVAHRLAMIRFSRIVGMQTSAYLLTGDKKFAEATQKHLEAWFINPETSMNPSLLYVQAIKGRFTGRGIGIIDAIHLIEVARSVEILEKSKAISLEIIAGVKNWFGELVNWLTTHPYGIDEMNAKNNHGTCWVMQTAMFARLAGNEKILGFCRDRFKTVLLPGQMASNGSFPLELKRTKPYGYSLFNLDAFFTTAKILSTPQENLFNFTTSDGLNLKKGTEFLFPFVADKSKWLYPADVMYFEEWPVRHTFLLFAGEAYNNDEYLQLWQKLNGYPSTPEVIRNLPIRNPLLWLLEKPVK
ncbi:MAG TPA: hypothetical protein DER09_13075 [Prolixibacteraceae bacterium]|nr:hypothetical protein [Prolixibacteraceae bacterium]